MRSIFLVGGKFPKCLHVIFRETNKMFQLKFYSIQYVADIETTLSAGKLVNQYLTGVHPLKSMIFW